MTETVGPVLSVRSLTVTLPAGGDRAQAVQSVSLDVRAGEILCIVGESGSGKSVVSQAVMGILPKGLGVAGGSIVFRGEDLVTAGEQRMRELRGNRIAMIFQEPMTALNPLMTVGRQIAEPLRVHTELSPAQRRARALEVMAEVNLPSVEQMYDSYPHQLSGGQRQRVMIAAALILNPALLIADEPTTALDVTTQAQILRLIKQIQKTHGSAVVFVTHDFGVVADIADRVAVMKLGQIVEVGRAADVLHNPQDDYTKVLLSAVPKLVPKKSAPSSTDIGAVTLAASNVVKQYGGSGFSRKIGKRALDDVSIEIRAGETLGVVGKSGSGKSTLARCVTRLIEPSGGQVKLCDIDFSRARGEELRRSRRLVQVVFQDPYSSLNPRCTVGQSIVECPVNFGQPFAKAWADAEHLMTLVGLSPAALTRYPHEFSGGQRQRICIARALAVRPSLLVADEAVSALDVSVQAQVLALLGSVQQEFKLAMLFITHDLRVAAQICDRVAVMQSGKIVEEGPTSEIFTSPRHDYTRQLIEAAPGQGLVLQQGPSVHPGPR